MNCWVRILWVAELFENSGFIFQTFTINNVVCETARGMVNEFVGCALIIVEDSKYSRYLWLIAY